MGCLLLAVMLPDHSLFFQQGKILFHFRFIKKVLLSWNVIGSSFAGGTEKLFGQVVHLFLKSFLMAGLFVNNKTERFDQLSLLRDHRFQLCYGVLQLSELDIFCTGSHRSLLGFDTFIIPEIQLFLKENKG